MFRKTKLINKIIFKETGSEHFDKGVKLDAIHMVESLESRKPGAIDLCKSDRDLLLLLLDGSDSWEQYVKDGKTCRSAADIFDRYFPKESGWPRWLPMWKVQVEALYAASQIVIDCFDELLKEEEEAYNDIIIKRWYLYEHEE